MRSPNAMLLVLICTPLSLLGSPRPTDPPSERHPGYTRWLAFVPPNGTPQPTGTGSYSVSTSSYSDLSIAVDSREVVHAVQVGPDASGGTKVLYMNTMYASRRPNGFSTPLALAATADGLTRPDIAADASDQLHAVWTAPDAQARRHLYRAQKSAAGWGAVQQLTPADPPYLRVSPPYQTFEYARPRVRTAPDGSVHVFSDVTVTYGPGDTDAYVTHTVVGGAIEAVPGTTVVNAPLEHWSFAFTASSQAVLFWREGTGGTRHYTAQGSFGAWGSKTPFGSEDHTVLADLAIDSAGNRHFVWDSGNAIWYQPNASPRQAIPVNQPSNISPRVVADSRDQVHVLYTSTAGISYAARVRNPDPLVVSSTWLTNYAADIPATGNTSTLRRAVITREDRIHLVSGNYYSRTTDYTLGLRDPAATPRLFAGAAVNVASGNAHYHLSLFKTKGVGPVQSMALAYNSLDPSSGFVGRGWRLNYEVFLVDHWSFLGLPGSGQAGDPPDVITLHLADGASAVFRFSNQFQYHVAEDEFGVFDRIERTAADTLAPFYKLTSKFGDVVWFNQTGRLWTVMDLRGSKVEMIYDSAGKLSQVDDRHTSGYPPARSTTISYEAATNALYAPRIASIAYPRPATINLAYSGSQLTTVQFVGTENPTYGFEYSGSSNPATGERINFLRRAKRPRGQAAGYGHTVSYFPNGRVSAVEDPPTAFLLDTDPDGAAPLVRVARVDVSYDESVAFGLPRETTLFDRRGYRTFYRCDPRRALALEIHDEAALASAPGITPLVRTFDAYGNLLDSQDRWGFHSTAVYDTAGSAPGHVRDNLLQVSAPKASGAGQDLMAAFAYSTDGRNRVQTSTSYATPSGGGAPVASVTSYDWNAWSELEKVNLPNVVRPDGLAQSNQFAYFERNHSRGAVTREVHPEGHGTTFVPDIQGNPTDTRNDGEQDSTIESYNDIGEKTSVLLPHPMTGGCPPPKICVIDALGRPLTQTDPLDTTTYGWDADSNQLSVAPPLGAPYTKTIDPRGSITATSGPDGSTSMDVDAAGNVRKRRDERGFDSFFSYDSAGRISEARFPGGATPGAGGGGPATHRVQYAYEGFDGTNHFATMTVVGSPANRTTTVTFDNRGRPTRTTAPDGLTKGEVVYDELDREVARQEVTGSAVQSCTVSFYDARGRAERVRVQDGPFGGAFTKQANWYFLYDADGEIERVVSPLGDVASPSLAHKTTYVRNESGRITQVIDGKGVVVLENVWYRGHTLQETKVPDPATKTATLARREAYTYDAKLQLSTAMDRDGWGVTYGYTGLGDLLSISRNSDAKSIEYSYEPTSQRLSTTLWGGNASIPWAYNTRNTWQNGYLTKVERCGHIPSTAWETVEEYQFDQAGRLQKLSSSGLADRVFSYNDFGELTQEAAGSKTITHAYNALGQPTTSTWSGMATGQITRTYNAAGLLESISDGSLEKVFTYDTWKGTPLDEIYKVGGNTWKIQTYAFDDSGNLTGLLDPENKQHVWTVDENGRVSQVLYDTKLVCSYTYTPGGHLDTETHHDAAGAPIATTTWTYTGRGLPLRATTVRAATGEVSQDLVWTFNTSRELTRVEFVHLNLARSFEYAGLSQLKTETFSAMGSGAPPFTNTLGGPAVGNVSARVEAQATPGAPPGYSSSIAITYDWRGNRDTLTKDGVTTYYVYGTGARLEEEHAGSPTSQDKVVHGYDEWGRQTTRTTYVAGTPVSVESFGYDFRDLLATYSNTQTGGDWQYDHWPTGERYGKVNLDTLEKTLYLHRFQDVATEYAQTGGGPISLSNTFVQGPGIDQKKLRVPASGGGRRHYLGDQVGTLTRTLDDLGSPVDSPMRTAWGELVAGSSQGGERYGFAQREQEGESGLVYMRNRMYDPKRGQFTQTDPLGLGGGDVNLFRYAENTFTTLRDPLGLCCVGGEGEEEGGEKDSLGKSLGKSFAKGFFKTLLEPLAMQADFYRAGWAKVSGSEFKPWSGTGRAVHERMKSGESLGSALHSVGNAMLGNIASLGTASLFEETIDAAREYLDCDSNAGFARLLGEGAGGFTAGLLMRGAGKFGGSIGRGIGRRPSPPRVGSGGGGGLGRPAVFTDYHLPGDVPDSFAIVKGGTKPPPPAGQVFSTAYGDSLGSASAGVPHGQVQIATAGQIRMAGGTITVEPEMVGTVMNYQHANVIEASTPTLFASPVPNPVPKVNRIGSPGYRGPGYGR